MIKRCILKIIKLALIFFISFVLLNYLLNKLNFKDGARNYYLKKLSNE